MIRRRVHLFPLLWLTVVWVLLWGNVSWANVLGGLALGFVILMVFPLPRLVVGVTVRPWPLLLLIGHFVYDLVRASVHVAWLTVRPGPPVRGVVFDVELRGRDELLQTVTAEMVALVPGTVVIDLDPTAGVLTIHALGVHDVDGARRVQREVLAQERRVLRALATDPSCGRGATASTDSGASA
ncbi:Na+/H+ antiporter subunit E [Luteipulveratus halotolerans]|uniref:Na+/H+ antiporter subunit E n=1 Tax=Luteipulveratus halotolerans TaxID=1631356 RepID=UPI0018D07481|nr:Na+/H+ antiporter subunit E [Luteipulveratus halotolerans]